MGHSSDYPDVPEWEHKDTGYKTGERVKYQGNIFQAAFWSSKPGEGDPSENGWRLYDELYDITTSNTTEQVNIIGYIPTWRKEEGFDYRNGEIYQYITHGIIAFLMFSESNLGKFQDKALNDVNAIVSDVVSVGHAVGTKILIALGGATDYGFLYLMERIGNNPSDPLLRQTVQKVVDFVQENDLDGVDLDLECWWAPDGNPSQDQGGRPKGDGPHPAGRGLTEFAKQLKEAMPDKIVSAALFATSWYGNNYDSELVDYLDWLAVMTYDLTGSWNSSPVGPHTALYKIREEEQESYLEEQQGDWPGGGFVDNPILSVEDSLWYWTNPFFTNWQGEGQKLPRNKLAAGVPIYGYDFAYAKDPDDLSGQTPPGYKLMRYNKDILSDFPNAHNAANANIKVSGDTDRPLPGQSGKYPYEHNIYFETPTTALEKLNFLKSVGAQGVIIWELSNEVWEEGKSIVKALYRNSGNPEKTAPPPFPDPESFSTHNWMEKLPGHKKLSEFNIPGTHDSGARYGGPAVACQDLTIREQLDAGIRFLDIRCRHIGDSFAIHHAAFFQELMFGEGVRDVCIDFLKSNPSECIVMMVKPEYSPDANTREFYDTFDWYVQGLEDFFYFGNSIPTLDDVRGKIVLFRAFGGSSKGIDASWPKNDILNVQDDYTVLLHSLPNKWEKVKNHLNNAKSDANNSIWYINFLSASGGLFPIDIAKDINLRTYDFLDSESPNKFGTIVMDFPTFPKDRPGEPILPRPGGPPQPPVHERIPLPNNFLIRKIISLNK